MKLFKVYIHTFPNNKVYIGITSSNENIRWRKNGTGYKKQHVYKAIKKYGWENIKHEILYKNLTQEEAEQKEIELIKKYKSNNQKYGYNIESGGHTNCINDITRRKISIANKGQIPWNKGKKMSDEFRRKCINSKKGKPLNDGLLNAIRKPVICIETNTIYESILLASEKTNVNVSNIAQVCKGKRQTAGKFHWKYYGGDKNENMEKRK